MASEKEIHGNEITSSNQLAAILFVSAAVLSAGLFVSSQIKGCKLNQAYATVVRQDSKKRPAMDAEMQRKYQDFQKTKPVNSKRVLSPTMAPVLFTKR